MIIACKKCGRRHQVNDNALKQGGLTLTCTGCGHRSRHGEPAHNFSETVVTSVGQRAWLIVHDEKTPMQIFEIGEGEKLAGRKSESRPCDLMIITGDRYMSRNHFWITGKRFGNTMSFTLTDHGPANDTFINTTHLKPGLTYTLKDGDLIQAGLTKIVFKISDEDAKTGAEAAKIVSLQPIGFTALLNFEAYEKN